MLVSSVYDEYYINILTSSQEAQPEVKGRGAEAEEHFARSDKFYQYLGFWTQYTITSERVPSGEQVAIKEELKATLVRKVTLDG